MKGSRGGEEVEIKNNNAFFIIPERVSELAEKSSAINHQITQSRQHEQPSLDQRLLNSIVEPRTDLKYVESFLLHRPVQSHPFTFITAVKRKLALAAHNETSKRPYNTFIKKPQEPLNYQIEKLDSTLSHDSLYQTVQKMNFVKPLKIPDVKISPKTLDHDRPKDNSNLRDLSSLRVTMPSQQLKNDKMSKNTERVHRKLDFTLSEGHSLLSSDDVEPLRAPDITISPSSTRQKDRDNSREKENRMKRLKKDDFIQIPRNDEIIQESSKRTKNSKHLSRKDTSTESKRTKAQERGALLTNTSRDGETVGLRRTKSKNFATSTLRRDDERRIRSNSGVNTTKMIRDSRSLDTRGRTLSSESMSDRCIKTNEKIIAREPSSSSRLTIDSDVTKYNDDYQILNALRQIDEHKQKIIVDSNTPSIIGLSSSQLMQQKLIDQTAKEQQQHKRIQDRTKASTSKTQIRVIASSSEINDEIDNHSDSSINKSLDPNVFSQITKNITQTSNEASSTPDEFIPDPTKISFRDDSYSQQDEFCDLVTPDMNLNVRTKRRKQAFNVEADVENLSNKTMRNRDKIVDTDSQCNAELLRPTALHMQFQAELHLFDSYNESLRRVEGVEKCLYSVKNDRSKQQLLEKQRQIDEETRKNIESKQYENDNGQLTDERSIVFGEISRIRELENENEFADTRKNRQEMEKRDPKPDVRVAITQTANDIATQTEARSIIAERAKQYPGITYERGDFRKNDQTQFSLGSLEEQFDDNEEQHEDISISGKIRAMSEISMHETTSSIKTETGTEISISTRDVTCSFNKYLDHEMAQLIKDEKLMYDKIEMLFKSREKTLNDRTKKLVKLEEQKRALRDTGQDSRISSVKKKQRALLLKLQQEKDEMCRLKELHKIASQERKLMLQKQRNMFNPQMSTKNILTKLKRSADCQSPRRLSGPMKGYDIRSNSSMSSLLESEKAQIDRAQMDMKHLLSDSSYRPVENNHILSDRETTSPPERLDDTENNTRYRDSREFTSKNALERFNDAIVVTGGQKSESKTRKFEEKMPNSRTNYLLRQKNFSNTPLISGCQDMSRVTPRIVENMELQKSESDTLVEEFSKKTKSSNHDNSLISGLSKETGAAFEQDGDLTNLRKSKALQVNEDSLLEAQKSLKKLEKIGNHERDVTKKLQQDVKSTSKRKVGKSLKNKTQSGVTSENILRTKTTSNVDEETLKSSINNKRGRVEKEFVDDNYPSSILEEIDLNESQNSLQALVKHSRDVKDKNYKLLRDIACEKREIKENISSGNQMDRSYDNRDNDSRRDEQDLQNLGNISTRSQVSTFTISRHSSGDSEKSFSRSVVIRAQDHRFKTSKKLEEALNAREAALVARRNCVEDWIAWHAKLKAEECRVARMEQAAFKLVSTAANALSYNDTTMSSDTSDVEGRVEILAEKLAERRIEMGRLRRETRKQAKRRLKALELNLLNQIKKYDTTINEMQLKLETQKGVTRESDKLAIESRTVADFKVPEISLKRIQELYNSNDLLRSRSESDLILSKTLLRQGNNENYYTTDNHENERIIYKTTSLQDEKDSSRSSKLSSAKETIEKKQSVSSVLEESKKFSHPTKEQSLNFSSDVDSRITSISRCNESAKNTEDRTNLRISTNSNLDETENLTNEPKIPTKTPESVEISEIPNTIETEGNSKLFSRKLESLHLTNKNLNDDISTLENDLKALSEMMSQFSKKSDDKLKSQSPQITAESEEIVKKIDTNSVNTSRDISEELSASIRDELNEKISSVTENLEIPISSYGNNFNPKNSSITEIQDNTIDASKSRQEFVDETSKIINATTVINEESAFPKHSEDIDFEARSKEILSVIERSIISEHIETIDGDTSSDLLDKSTINENQEIVEFSQNLFHPNDDVEKSITKIVENKEKCKTVDIFSEKASSINREIEEKIDEKSNEEEAVIFNLLIVSNENKTPEETSYCENSSLLNEIAKTKIAENVIDCTTTVIDEKSLKLDENASEHESIEEEISISNNDDNSYNEISVKSKKTNDISQDYEETTENHDRTNESSLENFYNDYNDLSSRNDEISIEKISNDWTRSDSFEIAVKTNDVIENCEKSLNQETNIAVLPSEISMINFNEEQQTLITNYDETERPNFTCEIDDVSMFLPTGESTNIVYRYEDTLENIEKRDSQEIDELDDILEIIARDKEENHDVSSTSSSSSSSSLVPKIIVTAVDEDKNIVDCQKFPCIATNDIIIPRPTDLNLTSEVEPVLQKLTEILQGVERNIALRRKKSNDSCINEAKIVDSLISREITSEDEAVVTSKISTYDIDDDVSQRSTNLETRVSEIIDKCQNQESHEDYTRNFEKEVTLIPEKSMTSPGNEDSTSIIEFSVNTKLPEIEDSSMNETIGKLAEKTFDILRDPEYEDISEESLEVSEILDRSESQRSAGINFTSRSTKIPEKYEIKQKSEDVLRILDEISQKSYQRDDTNNQRQQQHLNDVEISVRVFGTVSPGFTNDRLVNATVGERTVVKARNDVESVENEIVTIEDRKNRENASTENEEKEKILPLSVDGTRDDYYGKQENYVSSDSSEGADTPRGVSEIEMDSPRDPNESRLDIDALDDDLLATGEIEKLTNDGKVDFPMTTTIVSSEKDIETMIDKLKASLEQPGLEVAELEAKLLRIEQLQIELEIKKLEAEEVSYYMREIPNKPPPPYTPPGGVRATTTPQISPTLPSAVVPSNIEELTFFTEKATILIFNAKNSGIDINGLQPPAEICQHSRDNDDIAKHDRRIYNTFLFDLCKETIAELYRTEYEKPGPSWTKPNVKTKPAMKIPKNIEQLNDYVSKEVATLFGFKTKLQRENMVMRWSRKRRDRVDELLAREAQAEEDEWTKFHHDELAVKNELTVAILDTLLHETVNCVKAVYAKKTKNRFFVDGQKF